MKKIIAIIILTFALTLSLATAVSAESEPITDTATVPAEYISSPSDGIEDIVGTIDGASEENEIGELSSDNPFLSIYRSVSNYLPEILSVLTFAGSLILAFFYKKGLLPIVKASLSALAGMVSEVKKKADENEAVSRELNEALTDRLALAEGTLLGLTEKLGTLSETLDKAEERSLDRAKLTLVMTTQIDLLFDIFMSSSIPQFQKEIVGESVAKMKEALKEDESLKS